MVPHFANFDVWAACEVGGVTSDLALCAGMFDQRTECSAFRYQELVESVSSMSLMACAQASIPGTCGLTHHPTTPAASLATPHEPLGSFGFITIDGTPAIARFSI